MRLCRKVAVGNALYNNFFLLEAPPYHKLLSLYKAVKGAVIPSLSERYCYNKLTPLHTSLSNREGIQYTRY